MVIALQVPVYNRVIVTLVALHVAAQKDSADVAGHQVRFSVTIHQEACGYLFGTILTSGCEHVASQSVQRLIVPDHVHQVGHPQVII